MDFFCAAFLVGLRKTSNFGSSTVRRERLLGNWKILSFFQFLHFLTFLVVGCRYGTLQLESETFVFACPSLPPSCIPSNIVLNSGIFCTLQQQKLWDDGLMRGYWWWTHWHACWVTRHWHKGPVLRTGNRHYHHISINLILSTPHPTPDRLK